MTPQLGIATLSLGSHERHALEDKLKAAASAGFSTVELFDGDWFDWRDEYARQHDLTPSTHEGDDTSLAAATALGDLVEELGLAISCYQPLRNFEGFVDERDRQEARDNALGVLKIMPALGTDLLLCCTTSTPSPRTTRSARACADDLAWLADQASRLGIRVMYEALSFAAHRTTWQEAWEVVKLANRSNLGICCDSFNVLARTFADPYSPTGLIKDEHFAADLDEMLRTIPTDKIFFFQIADAKRMKVPLTLPSDPSVPPLRPWSRSSRLFPLETDLGAYLPVEHFTKKLVEAGYSGPWSLEVFNDSLSDPSPDVPLQHAQRGMKGLLGLWDRVRTSAKEGQGHSSTDIDAAVLQQHKL